MEEVAKDLSPRESFDMRLKQLLHENPYWTAEEDEDANFSTRSTIFIENCSDYARYIAICWMILVTISLVNTWNVNPKITI